MTDYFPEVASIQFEGKDSKNPLAFKHYDSGQTVGEKTLRDHLRFAVCY